MKNLFLLLSFFFLSSIEAQTITYYSEDFQTGKKNPTDMTYYDLDKLPIHSSLAGTGLGGWHILRNTLTDTNQFIGSTSKFATPGQANDWMITPQIKIYGKGTTLSWKSIVCDNSPKRDGYKVYVSTTGKEVADFKDAPIFSIEEESSDDWVEHSVKLDSYEGELIYIAFVNDSYDKYVIAIDDILVTGPSPELNFSFATPQMTDNGKVNVSVEVTGNSESIMDACKVCYQLGDKIHSEEFTGLNLSKGQSTILTMQESIAVALGETVSYQAWIEVNGEKYLPGNYTAEGTHFVPVHRVVIEEGTGTWCGYCPMGIVAFNYLEKWYPDNFIGIAIHGGQTGADMALQEYQDYLGITGLPNGVVNRQVMVQPVAKSTGKDYTLLGSGFEGLFLKAMEEAPDAEINGSSVITETDRVVVETKFTTRFVRNTNNDGYKICIVLLEDSVVRNDGSLYTQTNYYSSDIYLGSNIIAKHEVLPDFGGWGGAPQWVPMKYDHVARAVVGGSYEGLDAKFPDKLEGGKEYISTFSFSLPEGIINNREYAHVVGLLLDSNDKLINACKFPLDNYADTGIHSADSSDELYVEVENSILNVRVDEESSVQVELYSVNGSKVSSQSAFVSKSRQFSFPTVANGLYIVKVSSKTGCVTRKIVL